MGRWGRLLVWFRAVGAILCSSPGSQEPFQPSSPLPLASPGPQDPKVSAPPSILEPASQLNSLGTEGSWLFSTCGASGRHGPTQTQCDGAYAGTSVVVTVGAAGQLRGVQLWRVPGPGQYLISAYGAAGGKGAKNHLSRAHGVFVSAIFSLGLGESLYILVGQQGEDACPGGSPESQLVCLGESRAVEEHAAMDGSEEVPGSRRWAGGGGGGGLQLITPSSPPSLPLVNRQHLHHDAGEEKATLGFPLGDSSFSPIPHFCSQTLHHSPLPGGDASETDNLWADGEDGVSFIHPSSELYLQPLAVTENHGEVEIRRHLNCSHCPLKDCQWQAELQLAECLCPEGMELAVDNVTCMDLPNPPGPLVLMVAVVATSTLSLFMVCGVLILGTKHLAGTADSRLLLSNELGWAS
ncbi:hypothetical protein EGK_17389, partial [Macaca mulatta]